jgi:GAF domain-containing protein
MKSLEAIEEVLLGRSCTLDRICAELAKLFGVRCTEVGILRLEGELLRFLYPAELQSAGCIPISGSAVAARTAVSKRAELYNNFANVPHRTVFELVRLKDPEIKTDEHQRIQKLMSAPILGEQDEVLGVVQVSRKGVSPGAAGPDFTGEELQELERTARRVATLRPEILLADPKKHRWRLELQNEQKQKPKIARRHRDRTS